MQDDGRSSKTVKRSSPLQRNQNTLDREMHCQRTKPILDSDLS